MPTFDGIEPEGIVSFVAALVASDDSGTTSSSVTFVVVADAGPGLGTPLNTQLSAFGALSSPDTLVFTPGANLSISIAEDTFTNTNATTLYYAKCTNNTPLPSWLNFDPKTLSFSGTSPQETSPSQLPQAFNIELIASNVAGFAQAVTSFQVVVESHLLTFGNKSKLINTTSGSAIHYGGLGSDLTIDGRQVGPSDIVTVTADAPSWLSLSNTTLTITGNVPSDAVSQIFSVNATDRFGDSVSATVWIQVDGNLASPLISPIPTLNATVGADFVYPLNISTVSAHYVYLTIDSLSRSAWARVNSSSLEIYGHVPSDLRPQTAQFNLTAYEGGQSQSQIINIDIKCGTQNCPFMSTYSGIPEPTATVSTGAAASSKATDHHSWIAAAVLAPLAVIASLFALMCCHWRRRKRQKAYLSPSSRHSETSFVSRPPIENKNSLDLQKAAIRISYIERERNPYRASKAPGIPDWWGATRSHDRNSGFRLSQNTENDRRQHSRPDSWQNYIRNLDVAKRRDSNAASKFDLSEKESHDKLDGKTRNLLLENTELLRHTPSSRMRREVSRRKRASKTPFSIRPTSGLGHGRRDPGRTSFSDRLGSRGVGHGDSSALAGPFGWGEVRKSWRNLSRLSWTSTQSPANSNDPINVEDPEAESDRKTMASMLSLFPRPSTAVMMDTFTQSDVIIETSDDEDVKLIWQVKPTLSKNRLRTTLEGKGTIDAGPLSTFHRRRLRQGTSTNGLFSANLSSSRKSSMHNGPMSSEHGMTGEDQVSDPAAALNRGSCRVGGGSTKQALSSFRESRNSSAPNSAVLETSDEEAKRTWRHSAHPNPLRTNELDGSYVTEVSDAELIESLQATGQFSAAERLRYLRRQMDERRDDKPEDDTQVEFRSVKGKRLGLKQGGLASVSMRGDLGDIGGNSAFV